jgi:LAS superfamily LD-carboxypeptidase LdcB
LSTISNQDIYLAYLTSWLLISLNYKFTIYYKTVQSIMSNTLQGTILNSKFKKDYKVLGRKTKSQVSFGSKVVFFGAIASLVFSGFVFTYSYNSFVNSQNNLPAKQNQFAQAIITSSSQLNLQESVTSSSSISSSLSNNNSQVATSSQSQIDPNQSFQLPKQNENQSQSPSSQTSPEEPKITLRVFSGSDFQSMYESTQYQNVAGTIDPTVTDVVEVDNYIKALAEKRGYKLRPQALEQFLVSADGFLLQQPAADGWKTLKQAAAKSGINLVLTSGYRSIASQKTIFAADLAPEYQIADILSGKVDPALDKVLSRASVPGYSRHHTGYTIDVGCGGEGTAFKNTTCYQWIKKDNFAQARLAGYIPSYPQGAALQGPNPEEWEFVWVGDSR